MVRFRSPAPKFGMPHFLIRDTNKYGRVPERPKGTDCKSVVTDFSGSNPLSPTKQTPHHMIGSFHLQGLVQKSNISSEHS